MKGSKLFLAFTILGALTVQTESVTGESPSPEPPLHDLMESGQAIFGVFASEKSKANASSLAGNDLVDFVFYDMETGPFDVPGMREYMDFLGSRPIVTRLPPIREGREEARARTKLLFEAGVRGVVFPHVEDREQAELAISSIRDTAASPFFSILIIEDRRGVENAREIASTPGVSIVFPGPGDLRRTYEGDAPAVEKAIQTVLSACKESGVICGITAGADDIEKRLKEGFRVFIVTSPEALPIGRRAAGR